MLNVGTDAIDNWVLVTGVIRSGTTFIGKILSLPLEVDYIHEPFNTGCGMPGMDRRYRYVRPSLDTTEMQRLHDRTTDLLDYDVSLQTVYYGDDPWYRNLAKWLVGSRGPFYLRLAKANPFHTAAVLKDPTASMMAKYLHERFEVRPVVVIRHPVSLVASFRRLDWWPTAEKLLEQPALVRDHLDAKTTSVPSADPDLPDHMADACHHWCLVNQVLLDWADTYDWRIVRHETLCASPLETFHRLYDDLDLPWSERVQLKIQELTTAASPTADNNDVQDFQRDSEGIFETRLRSVSPSHRRAIFELTRDVALRVYSEASFALDGASPPAPLSFADDAIPDTNWASSEWPLPCARFKSVRAGCPKWEPTDWTACSTASASTFRPSALRSRAWWPALPTSTDSRRGRRALPPPRHRSSAASSAHASVARPCSKRNRSISSPVTLRSTDSRSGTGSLAPPR